MLYVFSFFYAFIIFLFLLFIICNKFLFFKFLYYFFYLKKYYNVSSILYFVLLFVFITNILLLILVILKKSIKVISIILDYFKPVIYKNSICLNVHSTILLSIYRNNAGNICGFVCTPVFGNSDAYNLSRVIEIFNCNSSVVCISDDKHIYTRALVRYIKNYADRTKTKLSIYVYDTKGIDALLLFDISYFNNHVMRIKDVPIGYDNASKASMTCNYGNLNLIEFKNLNFYMEDSIEIIFSNLNIDFEISYDELIEHINYNVLENKEIYLFYYHTVISLYVNNTIINKNSD